ncbi:response regulator [Telluribacter sp.]|jgi:CheY-like chemotaxis protein|uniref:response regulator n=1 Tax=Telluribacter sp. TaxID=1978767 RepID=UPI002E153179|nr:response regulator [Telluribacter sp.]
MIKNVLLIDDDDTTLSLVKLAVTRNGFAEHVIPLRNGKEGIDYFERLAAGNEKEVPEMIFLDIFMPGMDGWEFIDEYIRRFAAQFPNTHICVLSTSSEPDDQVKASSYPCIICFWNKPLFIKDLNTLKNHELLRQYF